MSKEIQRQLITESLAEIKPSQILDAMGKSFLNASGALRNGKTVTTAWNMLHAPTYGAPIPYSIKVEDVTMSGATTTLNTPSNQQVNALSAISAAHTGVGPDPIVFDINLTDGVVIVPVIQGESVPAGSDVTIAMPNLPIYWDKATYLTCTVTSGTATELTISFAYYSPVQ